MGLLYARKDGFLYKHIRFVAHSDAAAGGGAAVEAVGNVYLAEAYAWHAVAATFVPPAILEGGVQVSPVLSVIITVSP